MHAAIIRGLVCLALAGLLCGTVAAAPYSPAVRTPLILEEEGAGPAGEGVPLPAGHSWYLFANHTHTSYSSDSSTLLSDRIGLAGTEGADAVSITDHGNLEACSAPAFVETNGCIPMCGEEWGSDVDGDAGLLNPTAGPNIGGAALEDMIPQALARGATIIANHPFISSEPWTREDLHLGISGIEVWTTMLYAVSGGDAAVAWWNGFLSKGRIVFCIGGSDNHTTSYMSLRPCNYVLAESAYPDDLQESIEAGRISISSEKDGGWCQVWADPGLTGQFVPMGSNLHIAGNQSIRFRLDAYNAAGLTLNVITATGSAHSYTIGEGDPWRVDFVAAANSATKDFVRAEIRTGNIAYPVESISNPIYVNYTPDDADSDGLADALEEALGTDKYLADADGDGVSDYYEVAYDGDAESYDPFDPVANPLGGDLNALRADTDGDGMDDADELRYGSDPIDPGSKAALPLGALWLVGATLAALGAALILRRRITFDPGPVHML